MCNGVKNVKCLNIHAVSALRSIPEPGCKGRFPPEATAPFPGLHRDPSSVGLKGAEGGPTME